MQSLPVIDLKQLSKKLEDLNFSRATNTTLPPQQEENKSRKGSFVSIGIPCDNYEEDMKRSLRLHSEHIIDSVEWPNWREFVDKMNLDTTSGEFRPLLSFPLLEGKFILIRESHQQQQTAAESSSAALEYERIRELRVAVIGNVDAGKSTLLGVLSRGGLDDGRGRARIHCARHRHESESGRTSSVSQELLGYTIDGSHITTTNEDRSLHLHHHQKMAWEAKIGRESWKCISLIDLAGHERYLKTTMFGLTGYCPDVALLMVAANTGGLIGTSKEHLALAAALAIPVIVVVTKIDLAPEGVRAATLTHINKILKSPACKKTSLMIKSPEDVVHVIRSGLLASNQLCPIVEVSNVTGQGVDQLRLLFNLLRVPDSALERWETNLSAPAEYQINETYTVPGVGTVVSGVCIAGSIKVGDQLLLGPTDNHGKFLQTLVRGIQRKRVPLTKCSAGQAVSFALKKIKRLDIRYGMALISPETITTAAHPSRSSTTIIQNTHNHTKPNSSRVCREFTAQVVILYHSTTITPKYQAMLHCGTIRQTVQIISMTIETEQKNDISTDNSTTLSDNNQIGRTGDRAKIRFKFLKQPEMLKCGTKILFREGRTRGIGKIIELHE
jgi:GTPase